MVTDTGYPNRTFFELFDGACNGKTADKIYSIQVADWKKYFVDSAGNYVPTAAVVDEDATDQSLVNRGDHLRVIPTKALVAFMKKRGVTLSGAVYVTPLAFDWERNGEFENPDDEPIVIPEFEEPKVESNGKKILLALAVAAISLFSE